MVKSILIIRFNVFYSSAFLRLVLSYVSLFEKMLRLLAPLDTFKTNTNLASPWCIIKIRAKSLVGSGIGLH